MENLDGIVESILFVSGAPIEFGDICSKLDVNKKQVQSAIDTLNKKYGENGGLKVITFNNKIQLTTNSNYANEVSLVLNPIRERQLSKATLETLSIVAYKQPITRLEIEEIRGVGCDYAMNILLEHNLVEIVGRKDAVGRPVLFGTTDEFLKRFNLKEISELPSYDELLSRIRIIHTEPEKNNLYREYDVPTDKIVPEDDDDTSTKEQGKDRISIDELKAYEDKINELKKKNLKLQKELNPKPIKFEESWQNNSTLSSDEIL